MGVFFVVQQGTYRSQILWMGISCSTSVTLKVTICCEKLPAALFRSHWVVVDEATILENCTILVYSNWTTLWWLRPKFSLLSIHLNPVLWTHTSILCTSTETSMCTASYNICTARILILSSCMQWIGTELSDCMEMKKAIKINAQFSTTHATYAGNSGKIKLVKLNGACFPATCSPSAIDISMYKLCMCAGYTPFRIPFYNLRKSNR